MIPIDSSQQVTINIKCRVKSFMTEKFLSREVSRDTYSCESWTIPNYVTD